MTSKRNDHSLDEGGEQRDWEHDAREQKEHEVEAVARREIHLGPEPSGEGETDARRDGDHVREYTLSILRGQLERNGWEVCETDRRGGAVLAVATSSPGACPDA